MIVTCRCGNKIETKRAREARCAQCGLGNRVKPPTVDCDRCGEPVLQLPGPGRIKHTHSACLYPPKQYTCDHCGTSFPGRHGGNKYCSSACTRAADNARQAARTDARQQEHACEWCGIGGLHGLKKVCGAAECTSARRRAAHYKISIKELRELGDCCGICETKDDLRVDHDHRTGKVRGMLCNNCNSGLGFFADDPKRMHNAIGYLERGGSRDRRTQAVAHRAARAARQPIQEAPARPGRGADPRQAHEAAEAA